MKTENQEYSVSVQHSSSFVTTKSTLLLRWMTVNTFIPTGSRLWSVHIILFHSTLTFLLEEMLVEWTLWCTASESGPACSTLFSMCLLFHECTWALKLALASKSRVCLLVYVHLWEGARETVQQQELRTKSLWSRWSVANVLHLFVRTSEVPFQVWKASSRGSTFLLQQYFVCRFLPQKSLAVGHRLIMLNILLSALLDPDRRLRSFRRSERLASILVCSMFIARLGVVSVLCKRLFVSHPHVRKKGGFCLAEECCSFSFALWPCTWSFWRSRWCLQPFTCICFSRLVVF